MHLEQRIADLEKKVTDLEGQIQNQPSREEMVQKINETLDEALANLSIV